tara:strand:- start:3024 stop:3491 length:468 start_codon:yes stop_codon:yes gene_type:complete
MAKSYELIVGLKIPDTTALTALDAILRMGFSNVKNLIRETYYKFHLTDEDENFSNKISKVDILVNANKNNFNFNIEKKQDEFKEVIVAVKDIEDTNQELLSTLNNNLNFPNIKKIEKKILWTIVSDSSETKTAKELAEKLFTNKNYQEFEILDKI